MSETSLLEDNILKENHGEFFIFRNVSEIVHLALAPGHLRWVNAFFKHFFNVVVLVILIGN